MVTRNAAQANCVVHRDCSEYYHRRSHSLNSKGSGAFYILLYSSISIPYLSAYLLFICTLTLLWILYLCSSSMPLSCFLSCFGFFSFLLRLLSLRSFLSLPIVVLVCFHVDCNLPPCFSLLRLHVFVVVIMYRDMSLNFVAHLCIGYSPCIATCHSVFCCSSLYWLLSCIATCRSIWWFLFVLVALHILRLVAQFCCSSLY